MFVRLFELLKEPHWVMDRFAIVRLFTTSKPLDLLRDFRKRIGCPLVAHSFLSFCKTNRTNCWVKFTCGSLKMKHPRVQIYDRICHVVSIFDYPTGESRIVAHRFSGQHRQGIAVNWRTPHLAMNIMIIHSQLRQA